MEKYRRIIGSFLFLLVAPAIHAGDGPTLGGRLFIDGGWYAGAPKGFHSGVAITDVRLTGKYRWNDGWYAKIDISFARNQIRLKDVFIEKTIGRHIFRTGYMLGFFSLDQSSSSNDFLFLTASNCAETFYFGRRLGASYTLNLPTYYASAGVFCGDGVWTDQKTEQGYNASVRFVFRPYHDIGKLFHIGSGAVFRVPDRHEEATSRLITLKSKANTSLPAPSLFALPVDHVRRQWQWNIETFAQDGAFFVQAEYMKVWIERYPHPAFCGQGTYVEGGWVVKGSVLGYNPVDALPVCASGPEALILFGRFNYTDLNDRVFRGGRLHDLSVGANYYLNRNLIFRFNYSHQWADAQSTVGKTNWGLFQSRIQFRF